MKSRSGIEGMSADLRAESKQNSFCELSFKTGTMIGTDLLIASIGCIALLEEEFFNADKRTEYAEKTLLERADR